MVGRVDHEQHVLPSCGSELESVREGDRFARQVDVGRDRQGRRRDGRSGWAHSEEDNVPVGCATRLIFPSDVLTGGIGPDGRGCRGGEVGRRDRGGEDGEGEQEGGDESVGHGVS